MSTLLKALAVAVVLLFVTPLAVSAMLHWLGDGPADWRTADRSSAGLLPPAEANPEAVVRIFAARTVRWRGIFAVHSWIVVKERGAAGYDRWDYTAWGEPVRLNGFVADGRWFGRVPDVVFAADGAAAERLIPQIRAAIAGYGPTAVGDYRAWPGPNSNTFVAAVLDAVPELGATLPPTAIGKDFPYDGRWLSLTSAGDGARLRLAGYAGVNIGWLDGLEIVVLGAVVGIDLRRPALKLRGSAASACPKARQATATDRCRPTPSTPTPT
jgi:hypothetical protein